MSPKSLGRSLPVAEWVKGNGSDLPYGTWAWVRWPAAHMENGHGMTIEYRREGGWGTNGAERDCFEDPHFCDDGVGKYGWLTKGPRIIVTHYKIIETPEPPDLTSD